MQLFQIFLRIFLTSFLLFSSFQELQAQQIIEEQYIPIRGYQIHDVGYPFGVIPVGGGRFAFVQY